MILPVTASKTLRRRARLVAALLPVAALALSVLPAGPAMAKKKDNVPRPIVTGWLPYWTTNASIAVMNANKDLLQEVSPFWYTLRWTNSSSTIETQVSTSGKAATKAAAAAAGIELWPSFTDSMPARQLAKVMANPTQRGKLVGQMVKLAVDEGYAGLDLDFEKFAFSDGQSSWATTRGAWVTFIKKLGDALHAQGKKLAATTPPLCSTTGACSNRSGYWVYDWAGIGPYIDRLRIMAYDYSWDRPGPIGPYTWTEKIVQYAVTQVPSDKVQIGVATYGREWVRRKPDGSYLVTGVCPTDNPADYSKKTFDSVTVPTLLRNRNLVNADIGWNDTYKESYFRSSWVYRGKKAGKAVSCTVQREAWYGDARAVAARAELVAKYKISGIATWTIGGEDPAQWGRLRNFAAGISPLPTAVTVTAPAPSYYGKVRAVSATATSQGGPVADAAATLLWADRGSSRWQPLAVGRTTAAGTVSFQRTIVRSGSFRVVIEGDWERAQGSGSAGFTVKPLLRVDAATVTVRRGSVAKVKAVIFPKATRQRVVLQEKIGGRWAGRGTAATSPAGNPVVKVRATTSVTVYRFKATANGASAAGWSVPITVRSS